jgi:thiol:disulfide interchange protein DsbC
MKKMIINTLLCLLIGTSAAAQAEEGDIKEVQKKMKMSFKNLTIDTFRPSPIEGLFEVIGNGNVYYYDPKGEHLLFGSIYTKSGINLTDQAKAQIQAKKVKNLNLDEALKIGNGPNTVIEFTDPDCPYCRKYNEWAVKNADKLTRYVFFTPIAQLHPNSAKKAAHILCAKDAEASMKEVFTSNKAKIETCKKGEEVLAKHEKAGFTYGVNGTPSLVVNGKAIVGFNESLISETLKTLKRNE